MSTRSSIGKLWGPTPKSTRWLYEAMVRPVFLYGALVWAHKIKANSKYVLRLQRLAMLCLGSFAPSTPTRGLEVIFNFIPLHLKAKEAAAKAAVRIQGRNTSRWDSLGRADLRGHLRYYKTNWGPIDRIRPRYYWNNPIQVDEVSLQDGKPTTPSGILCYTDGSKIEDGPTGFGYIIKDEDTELSGKGSLGKHATVFQGETYAILAAANTLSDPPPSKPIHFYIDSKACLLYTSPSPRDRG